MKNGCAVHCGERRSIGSNDRALQDGAKMLSHFGLAGGNAKANSTVLLGLVIA